MKQLILFLCFLCSTTVFAQEVSEKNYCPKAGLKAFLESGYTIGVGKNHEGRISFLANVGYQINPNIFIGVGTGENYFHDSKLYSIPIYGDIRATFPNNWISAFVDAKIGASIADVKGLFFRPSIGCRLGTKNNTAFTMSVGYENQKVRDSSVNLRGITIIFGFDF